MNLLEAVTDRYSPYRWTAVFIWLAIIGFIITMVGNYSQIIQSFGLIPRNLLAGEPHSFLTLFTSIFLHAGFFHIFFNMYFLWMFGQPIEAEVHGRFYIILFITGGIAAGVIHALLSPGSMIPTIGASGAVSALMGWYAINYPRQQIYAAFLGIFPMRMTILAYMAIWFGIQLVGGIGFGGGIAWWAHIGGFVWGLGLGWLWLRYRARHAY